MCYQPVRCIWILSYRHLAFDLHFVFKQSLTLQQFVDPNALCIQIIFRDLKTSNILLDEHWNAKLSDFGLAREGPVDEAGYVSTVVCTLGSYLRYLNIDIYYTPC